MTFTYWLRRETGLTLYDFRVLDQDGNSAKEVHDLFMQWLEDTHPAPAYITEAIEAAAGEGFNVLEC